MANTVGVRELRIDCVIGTEPEERLAEQRLHIDLEVELERLGGDELANTVDYREMARLVRSLASTQRFQLIESLAEEAARLLLERWPAVYAARIEVRKPGAVDGAEHAFCRVEERRD